MGFIDAADETESVLDLETRKGVAAFQCTVNLSCGGNLTVIDAAGSDAVIGSETCEWLFDAELW